MTISRVSLEVGHTPFAMLHSSDKVSTPKADSIELGALLEDRLPVPTNKFQAPVPINGVLADNTCVPFETQIVSFKPAFATVGDVSKLTVTVEVSLQLSVSVTIAWYVPATGGCSLKIESVETTGLHSNVVTPKAPVT